MSPKVSSEVESAITHFKNSGSGVYKISTLVLKEVKSRISDV